MIETHCYTVKVECIFLTEEVSLILSVDVDTHLPKNMHIVPKIVSPLVSVVVSAKRREVKEDQRG